MLKRDRQPLGTYAPGGPGNWSPEETVRKTTAELIRLGNDEKPNRPDGGQIACHPENLSGRVSKLTAAAMDTLDVADVMLRKLMGAPFS